MTKPVSTLGILTTSPYSILPTGKTATTLTMKKTHTHPLIQKENIKLEDPNIPRKEETKRKRNPRNIRTKEKQTTNITIPLMMNLYPHPHHQTLTAAPFLPPSLRLKNGINKDTYNLKGGQYDS